MGVSRSATFLLAYLIKYRKMSLENSLKMCIQKRLIWPNDGFLEVFYKFKSYTYKIFIIYI